MDFKGLGLDIEMVVNCDNMDLFTCDNNLDNNDSNIDNELERLIKERAVHFEAQRLLARIFE